MELLNIYVYMNIITSLYVATSYIGPLIIRNRLVYIRLVMLNRPLYVTTSLYRGPWACLHLEWWVWCRFYSGFFLKNTDRILCIWSTSNGVHGAGDGIKMGEAIGASSIDLEWVQVHPRGLVKPDDSDSKINCLEAEAPREVCRLVLEKMVTDLPMNLAVRTISQERCRTIILISGCV